MDFVAAILITCSVTPALAEPVYLLLDLMTNECKTTATNPEDIKYKELGVYTSLAEAEAAMLEKKECNPAVLEDKEKPR
jgi:hypothetical protein